jgi:hypothetical protein
MKLALVFCFGLTFLFSGDIKRLDPSKFPVPPYSKKSLFYIHRSTNANTVVYEANFSGGNSIDPKDPVNVYWIRYGEKGQQRSLNYLERTFAYGVKCEPVNSLRFSVEFVASKERKFEVFVDHEGQACALMNINGKPSKLRKVFVQVAEDGWWPKIDYVEFFGLDMETNKSSYEKMEID